MYRILRESYPADPVFRPDLKALGLFINEDDEIRQIEKPEEGFAYKISKNTRLLEVRGNALRLATLAIVHSRLSSLGLDIVRLPLSASSEEPHVPILYLPHHGNPQRLLLFFGSATEDLGILTYRLTGKHGYSIDKGAATSLVQRQMMYQRGVGVLLANPGQLHWREKTKEAITWSSWSALRRKSAADPAWVFDERNLIPRNHSPAEHIQSVFEEFLLQKVERNVKLDILGVSDGCSQVISYLQENWTVWKDRIAAISFAAPHYAKGDLYNEEFKEFLKKYGRAYISHNPTEAMPRGSLLPNTEYGCATFSSGIQDGAAECILPHCYDLVLDFFHERSTVPSFVNPVLEEVEDEIQDMDKLRISSEENDEDKSGWAISEEEKISLSRGRW